MNKYQKKVHKIREGLWSGDLVMLDSCDREIPIYTYRKCGVYARAYLSDKYELNLITFSKYLYKMLVRKALV